MTPDVQWHLLSDEGELAGVGRESTLTSLAALLGPVEGLATTLRAVYDEGTAAAVFTSVVTTTGGVPATTEWLDSFRFADGFVSRYVSLQIG